MSTELPRRPSLSHLRKQAKELLEQLRRENPAATLVEAQHALARSYGFASWPKLKAHVEAAAAAPPPSEPAQSPQIFARLTYKARESLFFSRYEASQAGSLVIEPEHVLLGVVRSRQGLKGKLLDGLGLAAAREQVIAVPPSEAVPDTVVIPFSDRTRRVFVAAAAEADGLNHDAIGLAHVLLGVLRESNSVAARIIEQQGIRADVIRADINRLLDEEPI